MADALKAKYGERYTTILRYFFPEFITALLLYSLPIIIDSYFIGSLRSTPSYAVLGTTNNFLHLLIKIAEAFSVGTLVLTGRFHGIGEYKRAGKVLQEAFWLTILIGAFVSSLLYFGAYWVYWLLNVSPEMIYRGLPFLRLRAIGIFFYFLSFSIIGFLRGIKNTRVPMLIFASGSVIFLFLDYVMIFGKGGFPAMGLYGSAIASIAQNITMVIVALGYILFNPACRLYSIHLIPRLPRFTYIKTLLVLSWPVMIDKSVFALAYIFLMVLINGMGTNSAAAFNAVRDMGRVVFLPAVALAQIITLLVSNDLGAKRWNDIKANIYKVLFLSLLMVGILVLLFSLFPTYIVQLFDKNGDFTELAARTFPLLSILVFFDVLQLILAGALRGAADVRTVMVVRLVVCFIYFVPTSLLLSTLIKTNGLFKLVSIWASFYIGNLLMSFLYLYRFKSGKWKDVKI